MGLLFNRLILKIHINHLGALPQLCYAFKHLLNLMDKSLLNLKTPKVKTGQITLCQASMNLGRRVIVLRNPHDVFFDRLHAKEQYFCFGTRFGFV